jgi:hypothetical protein
MRNVCHIRVAYDATTCGGPDTVGRYPGQSMVTAHDHQGGPGGWHMTQPSGVAVAGACGAESTGRGRVPAGAEQRQPANPQVNNRRALSARPGRSGADSAVAPPWPGGATVLRGLMATGSRVTADQMGQIRHRGASRGVYPIPRGRLRLGVGLADCLDQPGGRVSAHAQPDDREAASRR